MSQPVQTEPYVDLKILECSNRSSVQFGSGHDKNNALFMNKVDNGFMLEAGDKVSVHSAIISEIGAGQETIELKGNFLQTISLNNIVRFTPYYENPDFLNDGYKQVLSTQDAVNYFTLQTGRTLNDNNVAMTIQYLKTANGENGFSLPRRYAYAKATAGQQDNHRPWLELDSFVQGATRCCQRNGTIVESDYQRDRNKDSQWNDTWINNREMLKVRMDGTKHTVFVRNGTTWFNASSTKPSVPSLERFCNGNGSIDPAVAEYILYREELDVSVPSGRRSADFVAETFSDGLQNASSLQQYYSYDAGDNPSSKQSYLQQSVLAATYSTDTYKTFTCANGSTFSEDNNASCQSFDFNGSGDAAKVTQQRLDWINCFQFVAFKRPEFVESGRSDWGTQLFHGGNRYNQITNVNSDAIADKEKLRITFNIDYNASNLERISRWIKTQELYPEFWDFRNASSPYHDRINTKVVSTRALTTNTDTPIAANVIQVFVVIPPGLSLDPGIGKATTKITLTSTSLTPNTVNVTGLENITGGVSLLQNITIDGVTNAISPQGTSLTFTITDTLVALTSDNSRFLHIDMIQAFDDADKATTSTRKDFGSDLYYDTAVVGGSEQPNVKYNTNSAPVFFTYIKEQENTFFEEPMYDDQDKLLSYGMFLKNGNNVQVLADGIGGIPGFFYNASGFFIGGTTAVLEGQYSQDKYQRFIGYDPHFTAYGNSCLGLYTPSANVDLQNNLGTGFEQQDENGTIEPSGDIIDLGKIINKMYLGAPSPKLAYDNVKDRFAFTDFYTSEYLGNDGAAGQAKYDANTGSQALVYRINKRLRRQNFCPGMQPYLNKLPITASGPAGTTATAVAIDLDNVNIFPMSIIDSHSGIAVESFNIPESRWNDSLMGILGFTYEQFNSSVTPENTMQKRVNTGNMTKLNKLTTSAIIKAEDTLFYHQNIFGNTLYQPNVLTAQYHRTSSEAGKAYNTPIVVDSGSLSVVADGGPPRQMLNPFYTIRSDLIDDAEYMGGRDSGERLPVMAHVMKSTESGDFFNSGQSDLVFTVTRSKPLSSITTTITDPDGSFANVNDNSAVIYKIEKNKALPVNLIQSLFGSK